MAKNSAAIGYNIRARINSQWQIIDSLHRCVAVRRVTDRDKKFRQCEDCQKDAAYLVVELTRFTPEGKRSNYPLVWGWCGYCDIGQEH